MYRNTRFGEILKGLSRNNFNTLVSQKQADKHSKGFSSWDHLIAMIYAHLSHCKSLRDIEVGFNSHVAEHYHLGCNTVKRSTLADANKKRESSLFGDVCQQLMGQVNRQLRRELKSFLYLLDSSSITLKGLGYDNWTLNNKGHHTQGIKLHVLLSPETQTPHYINITPANINDMTDALRVNLNKNATYVFDKGYNSYNWWHSINEVGAYFVTRFKCNAALTTIKKIKIPKADQNIVLEDSVVKFTHKSSRGGHVNHYRNELRRIVIARPDHDTPIVLATNNFKKTALEIAQCYKDRWQVELYFKWIKQNLKIKKYIGQSENAVRIQIFTALISYLLIALHRHTNQIKSSMKILLITVKETLFKRPELDAYRYRKHRASINEQRHQNQRVLF
jgi:IS4 transposase